MSNEFKNKISQSAPSVETLDDPLTESALQLLGEEIMNTSPQRDGAAPQQKVVKADSKRKFMFATAAALVLAVAGVVFVLGNRDSVADIATDNNDKTIPTAVGETTVDPAWSSFWSEYQEAIIAGDAKKLHELSDPCVVSEGFPIEKEGDSDEVPEGHTSELYKSIRPLGANGTVTVDCNASWEVVPDAWTGVTDDERDVQTALFSKTNQTFELELDVDTVLEVTTDFVVSEVNGQVFRAYRFTAFTDEDFEFEGLQVFALLDGEYKYIATDTWTGDASDEIDLSSDQEEQIYEIWDNYINTQTENGREGFVSNLRSEELEMLSKYEWVIEEADDADYADKRTSLFKLVNFELAKRGLGRVGN